jgi:hypothetical protein
LTPRQELHDSLDLTRSYDLSWNTNLFPSGLSADFASHFPYVDAVSLAAPLSCTFSSPYYPTVSSGFASGAYYNHNTCQDLSHSLNHTQPRKRRRIDSSYAMPSTNRQTIPPQQEAPTLYDGLHGHDTSSSWSSSPETFTPGGSSSLPLVKRMADIGTMICPCCETFGWSQSAGTF